MAKTVERKTKILNISMPPEMYADVEAVATAENRTKSELIREAFRHYQYVRRWRLIRGWGEGTVERLGIESDDDLEAFLG